jgi:sterol desaturase/sphingolipid hydroxylase (fatty acid hydroxylase superfamily)
MFDNIEARFNDFGEVFLILEGIGLLFLALMLAETLWDYVSKTRPNLLESFANASIAVGNILLERTAYGLTFILGIFFVEYYIPYQLPMKWWSWAVAILLVDLTYYWMHRMEHKIRILWAYHSVHHSSPEFNLTTGLRLAWIEGAIEWIFFVPMILAGFDAVQTIIALSVVVLYQTWIHTEKIGTLGWADHIFNTPSVHRVHHGSNKQYHDKNYGGIFIIWDRIFGTYKKEKEKVTYGITPPVETWNPIIINIHEIWNIAKDIRHAKNIFDALSFVFRSPGWKPDTET